MNGCKCRVFSFLNKCLCFRIKHSQNSSAKCFHADEKCKKMRGNPLIRTTTKKPQLMGHVCIYRPLAVANIIVVSVSQSLFLIQTCVVQFRV